MHIFITGIAGFLGSNLADYYIKKNFKVSGCDNLVGGDRDFVNPKAIFYQGDCEDLDFMTRATKGSNVICHAAAYAHEGLSNISPTLICNNNVTGSVSVFTAGIRNNVKRIVFCSSMARYGNIKAPFKEDDKINPVDPYGVSKVAAEKILQILCDTHNIEFNIAVPHNIIGPKQRYDDPFRNVASIMINLILQNRSPIVNIGPDEEFITINELYRTISNKLQFNQNPTYEKDRPNEVKYASCSSNKARKLLNYKTQVSLSDSLDKLIDFIKKKGPKEFKYNYMLEIDNEKTPPTWKNKLF